MKRQPVPCSLLDRVVQRFAYFGICSLSPIFLVLLTFLVLSTKNVLSHLTNTSQKLHCKSQAGVAKNSSRYSWQICLTFAAEDLACLGILCFASYDSERPRIKSAKVL